MFLPNPTIASSELTLPRFLIDGPTIPQAYRTLCQVQNGGFLARYCLKTSEPTRDGLDYVECHYLAGLTQTLATTVQSPLPDYLIPFSQNSTQYFAFDYSQSETVPRIRYVDTDVDQWLVLAPDFTTFLQGLYTQPLHLPTLDGPALTPQERNHYLLLADAAQLPQLLALYEADSDKTWFLNWLDFFVQSGTPEQQTCALKAYDTQQLYFKHQLPATLVSQLNTSFQAHPTLKTTFARLRLNW